MVMSIVFSKTWFIILLVVAGSFSAHALSNRDLIYEKELKKLKDHKDCVTRAAHTYQVPEWILMAVLRHENGPIGGSLMNRDGTRDYGVACINDLRIKDFHAKGLTYVTPELLMKDTCFNIQAAAFLLKEEQIKERNKAGSANDWFVIAGNYHYNYRGKYPKNHDKYKKHIKTVMNRFAKVLAKKADRD